jgi:outer membrane protein TolC
MSGPTYDASAHQNRINELELRRAKSAWLNLLTFSTSYYDQSGNKSNGNTTYVIPKYYFTVSIPLGIIFAQGNNVKIARESLALTKDKQEDMARQLKVDILSRYKQYRLYTSLIDMQSEMINDVLATSSQIEDKFKKEQVTVDVYIASQKTRNDELAKLLNLKLQQDLIKLDIEKLIGVPLESVTHVYAPTKK